MIALKIDVINVPNQAIDIIGSPDQVIEVQRSDVINIVPAKKYDGKYEVTPKFVPQTLNTADKMLTKDITIGEIPYTETPNSAGGVTVTIG